MRTLRPNPDTIKPLYSHSLPPWHCTRQRADVRDPKSYFERETVRQEQQLKRDFDCEVRQHNPGTHYPASISVLNFI